MKLADAELPPAKRRVLSVPSPLTGLAMQRNLWKASLISIAVYAFAVLMGLWAGFRFTLAVVPVFQILWTLFCTIRIVQLRRSGGHKAGALADEQADYGFWVGGSISSCTLFVVLLVLTQAV